MTRDAYQQISSSMREAHHEQRRIGSVQHVKHNAREHHRIESVLNVTTAKHEHRHSAMPNGASSSVETPNHSNRLLVLRHVCIEKHRMHFFRNASAAQLFLRLREPYRVWEGFAPAKRAPPDWPFAVEHHDRARGHTNLSNARWVHETSFLSVPHRTMDNMYHFHNNFFLPIMLNVLLSGSEHVRKRLFLFKTWPAFSSAVVDAKAARAQPFPFNTTHPAFYYIMEKLFVEVAWPVNDMWEGGRALCFRRFVWSQKVTPSRMPYYDSAETERLYQATAVIARFRYKARSAMGIPLSPVNGIAPSAVWISRLPTCFSAFSRNSLGRCVANLAEVLERWRKSGLFRSVRALDDFKMREDAQERDALLRRQMEILRDSDVFMGLHGAGLTNVLYLNERCAVVELRDHFWYEEGGKLLIYQAMARLQNCAYMSFDLRRTMENRTRSGYVLDSSRTAHIGQRARRLWDEAQNATQEPMYDRCCYERKGKVICKCSHVVL